MNRRAAVGRYRHSRRLSGFGRPPTLKSCATGSAIVLAALVLSSCAAIEVDPPGTSAVGPSPPAVASSAPMMPPEFCEPAEFPGASLAEADLPAPGGRIRLERDPCLTAQSLLGTYMWLEDKGIDAELVQGFQGVAGIEPWTAPLADGSGNCILIRGDDRNSWGTIACDSAGAPAAVERTAGVAVLRFVIENDAVVAYATSP